CIMPDCGRKKSPFHAAFASVQGLAYRIRKGTNHAWSAPVPRILSDADVAEFRERLCEVAARLFVERGSDGFHMRELAAQLGVSAMMPYRYFKDRDEILSVVRARAFRRFADQLEQAHATEGALVVKSAAVGRAYVQFALEEQTNYRLMFDIS